MKPTIRCIITLAALATSTVAILPSIAVSQFGQQEVDQSKFIAIASPFRNGEAHQLLVVEQIAATPPCWSESGSAPIIVNPLLLYFDFTDICNRSTDSNGFSIRMGGEDLALRYSLRILRQAGDMVLVGAPRVGRGEAIPIGRTFGMTNDYAKITLNEGWRFTKRTLGDRILGHIYITSDANAPIDPNAPPSPIATGRRFNDTLNDIYLEEINQALDIGFVAGFFEDNTFRPQAELTREQLVSMVLGALDSLPNVNLNIPVATSNPYSDVEANRWSAAKIQFAKTNTIVSGYQDGSFRPAQPVTRAELIAVMRRAAEYAKTAQGQPGQLQGNRPTQNFADINGHWANALIQQMSSFCGVASPLNEQGNNFAPDSPAQRNYATAATLRMFNCVKVQPPIIPTPPTPTPPIPTPSPSSTIPSLPIPSPPTP
jgi:N-acetylmuramoyl-L-alanine amidase